MSESKEFSLGAVLSITTGILLCDIGDVYRILNFMTGDNLFTHQLPRARRECAPYLLRQHPELPQHFDSAVTPENFCQWIAAAERTYGATLAVEPIPRDDHTFRDPVEEAIEMMGGDASRVIVLRPDEGDA